MLSWRWPSARHNGDIASGSAFGTSAPPHQHLQVIHATTSTDCQTFFGIVGPKNICTWKLENFDKDEDEWGWGWRFLFDKLISRYFLQLKSKLLRMPKNWLRLVILASNVWWWTRNLYYWRRSHYKVSGLKWFCHRCPSSGPCRSIESQQDEINLSWNNIGEEGANAWRLAQKSVAPGFGKSCNENGIMVYYWCSRLLRH